MSTVVINDQPKSPPVAKGRSGAAAQLGAMQKRFPLLQIVLLVVLAGYGALTLEGFLGTNSIKSMLVLAALVGMAAVGQSLVILLGGFDLSVAGFIVAGAVAATQLASIYELSFGAALLVFVIGAGVLGGAAGYLCHRLDIQPIIVTLAMGSLAIGLVQVQTGGVVSGAAPEWLSRLTSPVATTFGLPVPPVVAIWLVTAVVVGIVLKRTPLGRIIYFTGANPQAAELALIPTRKVWVGVFAFSAIAAGLAGVLLAGYAGNVNSSLGDPYLFQSLAAVIVGGTVFGGPGDYWRTVVGALLLTVLSTLLMAQGFETAHRQILYGVVILLAMAVYGKEKRLSDRI